jgi:hypothetical protein
MAHSLADVFRSRGQLLRHQNSGQMRRYVLDIGIPADRRWAMAFEIFESSLDQLEAHLGLQAENWVPSRQEESPDPYWHQLFWQKMTLEHHLARYFPSPIADNTSSISWYTASLAAIFPGCVQGALFTHLRDLESTWGEAVPTWRLPPLLQRLDRAFRLGMSAIPGINPKLRGELLAHASPRLEETLENSAWESMVILDDGATEEQEQQRSALILELALTAFESGNSNGDDRRFEETQAILARWQDQLRIHLTDHQKPRADDITPDCGISPLAPTDACISIPKGVSDIIPAELRRDINYQLRPLLFSPAVMLGAQSYRNRQHQGL